MSEKSPYREVGLNSITARRDPPRRKVNLSKGLGLAYVRLQSSKRRRAKKCLVTSCNRLRDYESKFCPYHSEPRTITRFPIVSKTWRRDAVTAV